MGLPYSEMEKMGIMTPIYEVHAKYKMPARYESKCFNRNIQRTDLEEEIFNRIMNLEASGEIEFNRKRTPVDYSTKIKALDEKINKILDLYIESGLPKETLDVKLADLNQQKENLITQSKDTDYEITRMEQMIKEGIPNLFECDLDTQTAIVDLFIDKIIVKENSLQIIWNQ